jgi:3-oxoacyl-[acyl-carrier protein] reductase
LSAIANYVESLKDIDEEIVFIHAATLTIDKLIVQINQEDLYSSFSVNLFSVFCFVKHLIPIMISNNYGSFIFISSVVPKLQIPGTSIYSTSKIALEQLSKQIVSEYSQFKIQSNVLRLGYFDSGLIKKMTPKIFGSVINRIPSKNLGSTSEIPEFIKLIVKSKYINGSVISVDGGIS